LADESAVARHGTLVQLWLLCAHELREALDSPDRLRTFPLETTLHLGSKSQRHSCHDPYVCLVATYRPHRTRLQAGELDRSPFPFSVPPLPILAGRFFAELLKTKRP
jgi:hypothetical protein